MTAVVNILLIMFKSSDSRALTDDSREIGGLIHFGSGRSMGVREWHYWWALA
jgi:hypothetical protein